MLEAEIPIRNIMNEIVAGVPVSELYTEEEIRQLAEEEGYEVVDSEGEE